MPIYSQPSEESMQSAYCPFVVKTYPADPGLTVKVQDTKYGNLVSLNMVDADPAEVVTAATDDNNARRLFFTSFFPSIGDSVTVTFNRVKLDAGTSLEFTVELWSANSSGVITNILDSKSLSYGYGPMATLTVPPGAKTGRAVLALYAGTKGNTSGNSVTYTGIRLSLGRYPIPNVPSSGKVALAIPDAVNLLRETGWETYKKFDLSFIAKTGFVDTRVQAFSNSVIQTYIDLRLVTAIAYRAIGAEDFEVRYLSRFAPVKGSWPDLCDGGMPSILSDRALTGRGRVKIKTYRDCEFTMVVYPNTTSIDNRIRIEAKLKGQSATYAMDLYAENNVPICICVENLSEILLTPSDGSGKTEIEFVDAPEPCNPFYVRWINQKGGWDYYMFEQNKKYTQEVDRGDQYVIASSRDPYAIQTRGELAPEVKNVVSAGAEQLGWDDFQLLKGIALSPHVDVHKDNDAGSWQRLLVDDTNISWDTRSTRGTVSYDFQLIDNPIQW